MKPIAVVFMCVLLAGIARSQTIPAGSVYQIPGNSTGNEFLLTVANISQTTSAQHVEVKAAKHSPAVSFKPPSHTIKQLAVGKEADVLFMFDVGRDVRVNKNDTVEFLISDRSGLSWTKSIIFTYAPPATYQLDQNFPNPFNPSTTICYQLPVESRVTLKVYDILGREVRSLVDEQQAAGYYESRLNASNMASGVYFFRIQASPADGGSKNGFASVRKLMVLK